MPTVDQLAKKVSALEGELQSLKAQFQEYLLEYTNLEEHFGKGFVAAFLKK